ncbi:MAG: response regulator [Verrucomicrobia bacterium]|nr:response regulator [Verrucomicrobiota bacterium]
MNTLLIEPEPATSPVASHPVPLRLLNTSEPCARILYVDDDPQIRRLGELVLARSGYEVDTATDGARGWEALQHGHYNLLITDNDMPRMTGLELASQARLAGMRLPIVLTSGSADALHDPSAESLGLAARLSKPFSLDGLLKTVEQALHDANDLSECYGAMISALTQCAQIQPYPHGGINE